MTENEFLLQDRITKIKSINELYDLENNAYISFSGGKDSTVLHHLIDEALPKNNIPRVFINTGIEYKTLVEFVKEQALTDNRIVIVKPSKNIIEILKKYGYPFKSKVFAHNLSICQNSGITNNVKRFLENKKYGCPKKLKYTFNEGLQFKVSEKCCTKLKKEPSEKWAKANNKYINITGIRSAEGGGRRLHSNCTIFSDKNCKKLLKFNPLLPTTDLFIEFYIKRNKIKLCELYNEPYSFTRTGCKGCPFSINLKNELDILEKYFPAEKKQCEMIWKPVYDEYRRIGYRLDNQPSLFD